MVMPRSRSPATISSTLAVSATPRAAVGSSIRITSLPQLTARAMATPWRWPPDKPTTGTRTLGMRTSRPRMIRVASRRIDRWRMKVSRLRPRVCSRPMNRFSVAFRLSARARSWYTVSIPAERASSGERNRTGDPLTSMVPPSGCSAPAMIRSSVLLPAPLSPTTAVMVLRGKPQVTPASATTPP